MLTIERFVYSATQEDDMGQLYLSNVDFLKNGIPASIIATAVRASCVRMKIRDIDHIFLTACRWSPPSDLGS